MCLIREGEERRSVACCLFRWLPIVFILAMLAWSYHVFVYQVCIRKVDNYVSMGLLLLGYHLLLFMFLWSWFQCICTAPVGMPDEWRISAEDVDRLKRADGAEARDRILANAARNLPINMCTPEATVRYCRYCWIIKPDRAHHCRSCKTCIRKMDHHCPWVKNCVHFHNFKYFVLFLVYAELYCLYIFSVMVYDLYLLCQFNLETLTEEHSLPILQHVLILIFNIFTLVMVLVSLLNVAINRTTVEAAHPPHFFVCGLHKKGFNIGCCFNIREVLGDKWYLWPIPIRTTRGDGLTYPLATERLNAARVQGQRNIEGPSRAQVVKGNMARLLGIHIVSDLGVESN